MSGASALPAVPSLQRHLYFSLCQKDSVVADDAEHGNENRKEGKEGKETEEEGNRGADADGKDVPVMQDTDHAAAACLPYLSRIPDNYISDDNFFSAAILKVTNEVKQYNWTRDAMSDDLIELFGREAKGNYITAAKACIISYVLRNSEERRRLHAPSRLKWAEEFVTIRSPVPWHQAYERARDSCLRSFTSVYPLMERIRRLWFEHFADLDVLDEIPFPTDVLFFRSRVTINCQIIRSKLMYEWVSEVVDLFLEHDQGLNPMSRASENVREGIATFMSRLLRQLVMSNMERWVAIAHRGEDGGKRDKELFIARADYSSNDDGDDGAGVDHSHCQLDPSPSEWPQLLVHPINELLRVTSAVPRIEKTLTVFADDEFSRPAKRCITSVKEDDFQVVELKSRLISLVSGLDPESLMREIEQRAQSLGSFKMTNDFVYDLQQLRQRIKEQQVFEREILLETELTWAAGIMLINYSSLRKKIVIEARETRESLISRKVKEVVERGRQICDSLQEVKNTVDRVTESTEELVRNMKQINDMRMYVGLVFKDMEYIQDHWNFVTDEGARFLSETDFELFHTLYNWPQSIRETFAASDRRFTVSKTKKEARLRDRVVAFELELTDILQRIITFRKKRLDSPLERAADNVKLLADMETVVDEAAEEKESINFEEGLLGFHSQSKFIQLDQIRSLKYPLDLLWQETGTFERKQHLWMSTQIQDLKLNLIKSSLSRSMAKVDLMKKSMQETIEQFGALEGDEELTENVSILFCRIQMFQTVQVPLLNVLTMPVLKEKHIQQMSRILSRQIRINNTTTLTEVVDMSGVSQQTVTKIEAIGKQALNEHALEVFLARMKNEWISDDWPEDALDIAANKFLDEENMQTDLKTDVLKAFKFIHETARNYVASHSREFLFPILLTPPAFIELMLTFKSLVKKRQATIQSRKFRYKGGVDKLELAAAFVQEMKRKLLEEDQPRLEITSKETEELMIRIEEETIQVEWVKERIASEEGLANRAAALSQQIRDECSKELAEAVPAVASANRALDTLVAEDIIFLRTMKNPPIGLKMVLEAVAVLLGYLPERRNRTQGYIVNDYWTAALRMLYSSEVKLLESLRVYDKDHVMPDLMKLVRENYLCYQDFDPTSLKSISRACESLAKWVKAIDIYDRVIHVIKPKKKKLLEAESELSSLVDSVYNKKRELQIITDKLQGLSDNFAAISKEKKDLEDSIFRARQKVDRAEKLLRGLETEKERWKTAFKFEAEAEVTAVGDAVLAAAFIVYLSGMTRDQRDACMAEWRHFMKWQTQIDFSDPFDVVKAASTQLETQTWLVAGLPPEKIHLENAVILTNSNRFCFMVDPDSTGCDFLKKLYKQKKIMLIAEQDELEGGLLIQIKKNISRGRPVLMEDVEMRKLTDPLIQTIIIKDLERTVDGMFMKIGEDEIEFHASFSLFMSRKEYMELPRVTYSHVCLINWKSEAYDADERKQGIDEAIRFQEKAKKEKQLLELEDQLLEILSSKQVNKLVIFLSSFPFRRMYQYIFANQNYSYFVMLSHVT